MSNATSLLVTFGTFFLVNHSLLMFVLFCISFLLSVVDNKSHHRQAL